MSYKLYEYIELHGPYTLYIPEEENISRFFYEAMEN